MPKDKVIYKTLDLPYTAEQALQIVLDVEHYHEFIPLIRKVAIIRHHQDNLGFDSHITTGIYKNISKELTSITRFSKTSLEMGYVVNTIAKSTEQDIILESTWNILAKDHTGCDVEHQLEFQFTNMLWHTMAKLAFKSAAKLTEKAFLRRLTKKC